MRLHRFFIKGDLGGKVLRINDGDILEQWRNVLRLAPGREVLLFNGTGFEARAKISSLEGATAELEVVETFKNINEPLRRVVLYCSVLKRENFELVAQKATEVGVSEIAPIIAERTEKLNLRMDRLEKIIKEAAEQSGRAIMPKIHEPAKFEEALAAAKENETNLIFDKSGIPFRDLPGLRSRSRSRLAEALGVAQVGGVGRSTLGDLPVGIFIGPEGGWTEGELKLAETAGFKNVSLGNLTLRAETAAVVASYIAVN